MSITSARFRRLSPLALLTVVVLAAGCGSSSSSSSSSSSGSTSSGGSVASTTSGQASPGVAAATANVAKVLQRPAQIALTTPLSGKIPRGKSVVFLACGVPACVQDYAPLAQAAAVVGWKSTMINEGLDPQSVQAAWQQAVRDNPSAVVETGGFPTAFFSSSLQQLEAKHAPIVSYGDGELVAPKGITAIINGGVRWKGLIGPNLAQWVTAKSAGKANVLFVYTSTFPTVAQAQVGFKSQLAKSCPGCKAQYYDAPATAIGTALAGKIADLVEAHPNINWVVTALADQMTGVPAALGTIGKTAGSGSGDIHLVTESQNQSVISYIQNGTVEATYTNPTGESMWQTADALFRGFLKQPVPQGLDAYTQWWLTKADLPPGSGDGSLINNVADYKAQFEKLWGVK